MSFKAYLTRDFLVNTLNQMQPLYSPVIDGIYNGRTVNHPFPYVSVSSLEGGINNIPLTERGTNAYSLGNNEVLDMFEPKPVRPSLFISAREMLDFYTMTGSDKMVYLSSKVDLLRQSCRRTAEAMAALALNGSYHYPVSSADGVSLTPIELGMMETVQLTPWTSSTSMGQILKDLETLAGVVNGRGFGGNIAFIVAPNVRQFIYELLTSTPNATNLATFDTATQDLIFGGYRIKTLSTTYYDYTTSSYQSAIDAGSIIAIDLAAEHKMIYCATEDIQNNFGALPFVVSQYENPDMNGIKLFGQSKPFPAPVIHAMCRANTGLGGSQKMVKSKK
jgi:hypothetical protein